MARKGCTARANPRLLLLAAVTQQVEAVVRLLWWRNNVSIQHAASPRAGKAHDGFVALDPEGYFLEFERFNPTSRK